jgi:hypothetical protein
MYSGTDCAGWSVLHRCDNRLCCNPAHLYLGTQADNMHDRIAHGAGYAQGEKHHAAKFTTEDIQRIRQSTWSRRTLAAIFGTAPTYIDQIRRGATWAATP